MMKDLKFRMLKAEEIEVRPQSIKNGKATMLLYMNSRVVVDLLNETVGAYNWTSEYYEVNGKLVMKLGIWDEDKNQFVYKSDTGSESNIEAEKGQFSDCYKRCMARWGVTELYSAPSIVINDDGKGNKGYYVKFIKYDEYTRHITELAIADRNDNIVFKWLKKNGYEKEEYNKEDNYNSLRSFCTGQKGKIEIETLKKFFNYWSNKINNGQFEGIINPQALFKKWIDKNNK